MFPLKESETVFIHPASPASLFRPGFVLVKVCKVNEFIRGSAIAALLQGQTSGKELDRDNEDSIDQG